MYIQTEDFNLKKKYHSLDSVHLDTLWRTIVKQFDPSVTLYAHFKYLVFKKNKNVSCLVLRFSDIQNLNKISLFMDLGFKLSTKVNLFGGKTHRDDSLKQK